MSEFVITEVIDKLKKRRSVFCSEADFQLEFAWTIKELYKDKDISVRLEYCPCSKDGKITDHGRLMHVDIVVFFGKDRIPIELKYKTKGAEVTDAQGETFVLANHSAKSDNCYWYLKDIKRIETLRDEMEGFAKGYAIMLTNDESYQKSPRKNCAYKDFAIDKGPKQGKLEWNTPDGTSLDKESIELKSVYPICWEEYSKVSGKTFWYLVSTIEKGIDQ